MYQEIPKPTANRPTKMNESGMLPFKLSEILFNFSALFAGVFILIKTRNELTLIETMKINICDFIKIFSRPFYL